MRAAAVAAAVAVAGCGSGDPKVASTTAPTSTTTTTTQQKPAEPKGMLSPEEYKAVRAAYKMLAPLNESKQYAKVLRVGRRACTKLTAPTELVAAVRAECVQTMRFAEDGYALVTSKAECTKAAQAGDTSCFAHLFRSIGRSVRVAAVRAAAVNSVLRKRAIRGDCAKALGTTPAALAAGRDAQRAGLGAAHALEAKNQDALQRASTQLSSALDRMSDADVAPRVVFARLKSCV